MFRSFRTIWNHRKMLWATTLADIRTKYAGSVLGKVWLLLYPVLMLTAYSIVYVFILRLRLGQMSSMEYVMLIFAGLIPFLGFSEGLSNSVVSVTANASLIKNTLYPIELIPVKSILFSQCTEVVGLCILLFALLLNGSLSIWSLMVFPLWFFQVMFGMGVGWIISSLNVILRDMQSLIGIVTMFLMMVSPIAYTPEMIPAGLRSLLRLNPLYYFITAYQDCLIYGRFPTQNTLPAIILLALTAFIGGYWFFEKMKQIFDDNI